MKILIVYRIIFSLFFALTVSCEEFLDVGPPKTQLVSETVFTSAETAEAAVNGIYSYLMSDQGFASGGAGSVTLLAGLSSDELVNYSFLQDYTSFYENALSPDNFLVRSQLWEQMFRTIYYANAVIEGLSATTTIDEGVNARLMGESLFIRAFCNFYLVNLFGPTPIILGTSYQGNQLASRSDVATVYDQIVNDLSEAIVLLGEEYPTSERVRPNRFSAIALLARVRLYRGHWEEAEMLATDVIDQGSYALTSLSNTFLATSQEAIWQLRPVQPNYNTWEAVTFLLAGTPYLSAMSPSLAHSFEPGDIRRVEWMDSVEVGDDVYYFPTKYKASVGEPLTEHSMVLRLAELYLVRAEARVMLGDIEDGRSDINMIRERAGLSPVNFTEQEQLLDAIGKERRSELFTEWGHRWLDLKRTGRVGEIISAEKSGWDEFDQLYPIPVTELLNGVNLTQNPGY